MGERGGRAGLAGVASHGGYLDCSRISNQWERRYGSWYPRRPAHWEHVIDSRRLVDRTRLSTRSFGPIGKVKGFVQELPLPLGGARNLRARTGRKIRGRGYATPPTAKSSPEDSQTHVRA